LDIPYPEPRVTAPNRFYAELLLDDYAGPTSELTAVHQYIYHDFTFHERYPELAELEECIAIVEMKHLELLAETILLLGVDPRFWYVRKNRYVYWDASFPYYGTNVCDRLAADIEAEEGAIKQYRAHQAMIKDPHIVALLERIILDEQHHLALFTEAYKKHC
jgi:bacterioferritin